MTTMKEGTETVIMHVGVTKVPKEQHPKQQQQDLHPEQSCLLEVLSPHLHETIIEAEKQKKLLKPAHTSSPPQRPCGRDESTTAPASQLSGLGHDGDAPFVGREIHVRHHHPSRNSDKKSSKKKKKKTRAHDNNSTSKDKQKKQRRTPEEKERRRALKAARKSKTSAGELSDHVDPSASVVTDSSADPYQSESSHSVLDESVCSASVSYFLSPSLDGNNSSIDDCVEPSPDWLQSVRQVQESAGSTSALHFGTNETYDNDDADDESPLALSKPAPNCNVMARKSHPTILDVPSQSFQSPFATSTSDEDRSLNVNHLISPLETDDFGSPLNIVSHQLDGTVVPVGVDFASPDSTPSPISSELVERRGSFSESYRSNSKEKISSACSIKTCFQTRRCITIFSIVFMTFVIIIGVSMPFVLPWVRHLTDESSASINGSSTSQGKCFTTQAELENAVDDYLDIIHLNGYYDDNKLNAILENSSVVQTHGFMKDWCVNSITQMDRLFSSYRNPKAVLMNEFLSQWNVSQVTSMREMFHAAVQFDQDLSDWDVSRVRDMGSMFQEAILFRRNLCPWQYKLVRGVILTDAFTDTRCDARVSGSSSSATLCVACPKNST